MYNERMVRLRERMAEVGTDLVVIGPSSHLAWLTGMPPHSDERPALLIVAKDHAGFLMPALNVDSLRSFTKLPYYPWTDAQGPNEALDLLLADCGAKRDGLKIAIDETTRADFVLLVIDALPSATRDFLTHTVSFLRSQKDETEYALLKMNAVLNDEAMRAGFAALKEGVTELNVARAVLDSYAANGATPEFTIVCFGENSAVPAHSSGERKLKLNDAVLIAIGARKNGYPSDMTRVGVFGGKPAGLDEVHAVLERAMRAAIAVAKPGVSASEVDKAARDVVVASGYGDFFLHRTGHGIGIDIHEPPYITGSSETILREGNVFTIAPGIYLRNRFGLRLEEIVILRSTHAEVLSELSRDSVHVRA